jgi:hypothetical protein
VQEDGDREALRPPARLRGSVQTSARRRVTTALAIVSRVARLVSECASSRERRWTAEEATRVVETVARSGPTKVPWQHGEPTTQGPGAGGRRPGGSDWPVPQSGVACRPRSRRPVAGMLRTRRGPYQCAGDREVESDGKGCDGESRPAEIAARPVAEKAPGQPGSADCPCGKCRRQGLVWGSRCWSGGGRGALTQPQ